LDNFMTVFDIDFMLSAVPIFFESLHISDSMTRTDYMAGKTSHLWEIDDNNPYQCSGEKVAYPSWRAGGIAGTSIQNSSTNVDGTPDVSILGENAHNFEKPVLFLASECNTWLGEDTQQIHANLFPNAEVKVIQNAGHYMFNDNLEESLAAVRAYFNSI